MQKRWRSVPILLVILCVTSYVALNAVTPVKAQASQQPPTETETLPVAEVSTGDVQDFTGSIRSGDFFYYYIPDLRAGETLSVYVEGISGNLDPIVGLLPAEVGTEQMEQALGAAFQGAIESGEDPLIVINQVRDDLFLVWDDDSGDGLAASFEYVVPKGGDYRLIVANALAAVQDSGFGRYRMTLGVDAPQVQSGEAVANGAEIAELDRESSPSSIATEELTATVALERPLHSFELQDMQPGDTVYARVEATSGNLRPALVLRNYADKPVRSDNISGQADTAMLEYTLEDIGNNFQLDVEGCCPDAPTSGDYRLLLGVNAPEVLDGTVVPTERSVVEVPTPVAIGVKLQQVVEVNESNEFFTVVASLQMEWNNRSLAFNPDECQCLFKSYTGSNFGEFLNIAGSRWPEFTLFNQQGNRWSQNKAAVIYSDGRILYFERFTTNLQVDFDFTKYPFDTQTFNIKVDSVYPETMYYFTELDGYTEIDPDHGEDEFIITGFETEISSEAASTRSTTSRFTFSYTSPRHLEYYMLQIFIPILLIIAVSWVTFFLRDYGRRIEVASANLLLFIAFSFSLADNYPRLGYVTFLDAIMATIFVVNALVVVYNVWLKKIEMQGQPERAERIDNVLDWAYPAAYLAAILILVIYFFR